MIELKIDTHGFEKKLEENARRFPFRMFKAYKLAARKAETKAKALVSGPPLAKGQRSWRSPAFVLHVRSHRLRSSLSPFLQKKGKDRIVAGIGTLPFYAVYHEKGKGKKSRPFLKPSVEKAFDWLMREIEVWHD